MAFKITFLSVAVCYSSYKLSKIKISFVIISIPRLSILFSLSKILTLQYYENYCNVMVILFSEKCFLGLFQPCVTLINFKALLVNVCIELRGMSVRICLEANAIFFLMVHISNRKHDQPVHILIFCNIFK